MSSNLKKKEKAFAISKFFLDAGAGLGHGGPAGVVGDNLRESVSSAAAANAAELQRKREKKQQKKGLFRSLLGGGAGFLVGGAPGMALGAGLAGAKSAGDVSSAFGGFASNVKDAGGFAGGPLTKALGWGPTIQQQPIVMQPGATGTTPGVDTTLFPTGGQLTLRNNPYAQQNSLGTAFDPYDDQLRLKNRWSY